MNEFMDDNEFMDEDGVSHEEHLEYVYKIMMDGYNIVIRNEWPVNFTRKMKLNFLDAMYEYFKVREHYEKCDKINKLQFKIKNEEKDDGKINN